MNKNVVIAIIVVGIVAVLASMYFVNRDPEVVVNPGSTSTPSTEVSSNTNEDPENITVGIGLIALEDNGASGRAIGCNDSVVLVNQEVPYTVATLQAALERLFSIKTSSFGESGLYNSLSESDLAIEDVVIENGVATIELTGQPVLGGVCDTPRFKAQIEETATQFDSVNSAEIFLNGEPIDEAMSEA